MVRSLLLIVVLVFLGQGYISYHKRQPGYVPPSLDAGEFLISSQGGSRIVKLRLFDDAFISENCFKKNKLGCKALHARKGDESLKDFGDLPKVEVAIKICEDRGGMSLLAKNYKDFGLQLCEFDDESLIGIMDLL